MARSICTLHTVFVTSLSYGRIFCLESQKIDGTYQRYNHYSKQILFIIYKYIKYSVPSIF